ncbi:hypothetical protein [Deinococcus ruber]|nr:hypothetical protein [Deinococcus ruber]
MNVQSHNDFFKPRTPLQAAEATCTTKTDTYFVSSICLSTSPTSRTTQHSVTVTRLSDGKAAPSHEYLIATSRVRKNENGDKVAVPYYSASGVGSWGTWQAAMDAFLAQGVAFFEGGAA